MKNSIIFLIVALFLFNIPVFCQEGIDYEGVGAFGKDVSYIEEQGGKITGQVVKFINHVIHSTADFMDKTNGVIRITTFTPAGDMSQREVVISAINIIRVVTPPDTKKGFGYLGCWVQLHKGPELLGKIQVRNPNDGSWVANAIKRLVEKNAELNGYSKEVQVYNQ